MKSFSFQRYLQVFQKFKSLDSATLDCYQQRAVLGLITCLIIWSLFVITRPIDQIQQDSLNQLATQSNYPLTREMAYNLLQESSVNRYQYFRVLRAIHAEQHGVHIQEDIIKETPRNFDHLVDQGN